LISLLGSAQVENAVSNKRLNITSFEMSQSYFFGDDDYMGIDGISDITLNHNFPLINLADFNHSAYHSAMTNISIQLGLRLNLNSKSGEKLKGNPQLRFGLSLNQGFYMQSSYYNDGFSTFYDSIYTTFQGNTISSPVDTFSNEYYAFSNVSNRLRFQTSILWNTNLDKRWSFYGGFGFGLGISVNSISYFNHTKNSGLRIQENSNFNAYNSGNNHKMLNQISNSKTTTYDAKTWYDMNLLIPLGVNFKLSNNQKSFFNHSSIFVEGSPNLWLSTVKGGKLYKNMGYSASVGLKINL
jgi:hypothetical protein